MNISRMTAATIQSRDDIKCSASSATKDGKYIGFIGTSYRLLIMSEAIYNSQEEAIAGMKRIVETIRSRDLADATIL